MGSGKSKIGTNDRVDQEDKSSQPAIGNKEDNCSDAPEETVYEYDKDVDSESIDSTNSDDTYGLARRMPRYIAVNSDDTHDDIIEIIAEENKNVCQSLENDDISVNDDMGIIYENDPGGDFNDKLPNQTANISNKFEKDTIGYYISQSNNEDEKLTDQVGVEPVNKGIEMKVNDVGMKKKEVDTLYEEFNLNYSSRSRRVKKRTVSNKQTLVLTKVGNRYKYITVPAYLPGQRVYSSRSFVKNYMTSPQYVYRRGIKGHPKVLCKGPISKQSYRSLPSSYISEIGFMTRFLSNRGKDEDFTGRIIKPRGDNEISSLLWQEDPRSLSIMT